MVLDISEGELPEEFEEGQTQVGSIFKNSISLLPKIGRPWNLPYPPTDDTVNYVVGKLKSP